MGSVSRERIPLMQAVQELEAHSVHINSVKEWAKHMGYSRCYFSRQIKSLFGCSPKKILVESKLERVKKEILTDPEAIGFKIAVNVGLNDEKALHKFLNTHFDITLTDLRQQLL